MTFNGPTQVITRIASPEDALSLGLLGIQVFLDTYATEGVRDSIAQAALDAFSPATLSNVMATPGTLLVVAEINHHLVGFAQIALHTEHNLIANSNAAQLQRLYVQERFTGKGIGFALLQSAERHARLGGAPLLWATVWVGNPRALGFYPRQGYEYLGPTSYTLQNETHENALFAKFFE
ncbi:GNAT family N-acetyltransferase [Pseudomonas sp. RIT-PI-S]|uniref:GNAT family N-acetyltransferase n=1 Tax=Pseudomonas sp. RIT-PI-S TaxID=3035295 RepID=UPI0021D81EB3|nr:GNAT family N-acetyltransferase [Pseudomonas sp. RIT-PI-S]